MRRKLRKTRRRCCNPIGLSSVAASHRAVHEAALSIKPSGWSALAAQRKPGPVASVWSPWRDPVPSREEAIHILREEHNKRSCAILAQAGEPLVIFYLHTQIYKSDGIDWSKQPPVWMCSTEDYTPSLCVLERSTGNLLEFMRYDGILHRWSRQSPGGS